MCFCANTSGCNNTAVGYQSLDANTFGCHNTAVGNAAMFGNTTGRCNVALGVSALRCNVTGSRNTALGRASLYLILVQIIQLLAIELYTVVQQLTVTQRLEIQLLIGILQAQV